MTFPFMVRFYIYLFEVIVHCFMMASAGRMIIKKGDRHQTSHDSVYMSRQVGACAEVFLREKSH